MRKTVYSCLLAILLLVLAVPAFADGGTLSMYVAYGKPELIASEFEKASGIKVEFLPMSSGEVLTRLKAEQANPRTDIWFGGGSDCVHPGEGGRRLFFRTSRRTRSA